MKIGDIVILTPYTQEKALIREGIFLFEYQLPIGCNKFTTIRDSEQYIHDTNLNYCWHPRSLLIKYES